MPVREPFHVWHARRWILGCMMGSLLASGAGAQAGPDAAARLDQAISAAESSLQKGDLQAAEGHYREAVFEGWLLRATLERLDGQVAKAREALGHASTFAAEDEAFQSLAAAHLQLGGTAEAIEILRGRAGKEPGDTETRRLLAKALAAGGQVQQAVEQLDAASAHASLDPQTTFVLATEYLWLKKVDAAERLFARVVEARPIPQTHVLIGRAYRDAGEYDRARAELEAALEQDPSVRRAHYYLGMAILEDARAGAERRERALAEFRAELKLAPEDALANDQLGLALLEAGREAEALPALEAATRGEARSLYFYHLGRGQLALDRPAEAIASSRRALELGDREGASASDLQKIHYQLGLALRKTGEAQEAATQLAEASRIAARGTEAAPASAPTDGPLPVGLSPSERHELRRRASAGLARAYFNLGVLQARSQGAGSATERFARAAALFEKAAELDPDFPRVQSALGIARFNAGQFDEATGPLTRALAADPADGDLKRMLAVSWLNTKAWEKVAALLRNDPERPRNASLQFAYGLALVRSHRAAEAETVLLRLRDGQGETAELVALLGQAYAEEGKYDAALASLERALQLQPDVGEAHGTLGLVYLKQGRLAEAETALRAELRAHPSDVLAQIRLAMVLDSQGRPDEALPLLRAVLQSKADSAEALYLLGKILLARGKAGEAVEPLEAAARLIPEDAEVRDELGRAYEKLGRKDLAQRQFAASLQLKARH